MYKHITVKVGITQEFFYALACFAFLEFKEKYDNDLRLNLFYPLMTTRKHYIDHVAKFGSLPKNIFINIVKDKLYYNKLADKILELYKPTYIIDNAAALENINNDIIQPSNVTPSCIQYVFDKKIVDSLLPSARERIDAKNWLKNTLILHGINEKLVASLLINN